MNDRPRHGSHRPSDRDFGGGVRPKLLADQVRGGSYQGVNGSVLPDTDPGESRRSLRRPQGSADFDAWELESPYRRTGRPEAGAAGPEPLVADQQSPTRSRRPASNQDAQERSQTITVSVPALRTFMTLTCVVVLSVVLSVVATISVIAVMNAGVILPQYAQLNQPTKVSDLGVCVEKDGKISTPTGVGSCTKGTFVHVQPQVTQP